MCRLKLRSATAGTMGLV